MKKYILLLLVCFSASFQLSAQNRDYYFEFDMGDLQEQLAKARKDMKDTYINLDSLRKDFNVYKFNIDIDGNDFKFNKDSIRMYAWNGIDKEEMRKMGEEFRKQADEFRVQSKMYEFPSDTIIYSGNTKIVIRNNNRNNRDSYNDNKPIRTEKKTYSNISQIDFNHSYGEIKVRESNSKQVELEILYYKNEDGETASAIVSESSRLLSINTEFNNRSSRSNKPSIDYIVSIPRGTGLSVNLRYGSLKMGDFPGKFKANIEYSDIKADALGDPNPQINSRYGTIKIGQAKQLSVTGDYTTVDMNSIDLLNISGKYNNYNIGKVQRISSPDDITYGNFKLGDLSDMSVGEMKYVNFTVDNLQSNLKMDCAYSNIKVNASSSKVDMINISGRYSEITVSLPSDAKASFDTSLRYGNIDISDKYKVTYTRSENERNNVVKVGRIGSGSPTTKIIITNKYADIKIK